MSSDTISGSCNTVCISRIWKRVKRTRLQISSSDEVQLQGHVTNKALDTHAKKLTYKHT